MLTKIIVIALISAFILYYLKNSAPEFFSPTLVVVSTVILILSVEYIVDFIDFFKEISIVSGLSGEMISLIIKILAVSYLVEFAAGVINDMQLSASDKKMLEDFIIREAYLQL